MPCGAVVRYTAPLGSSSAGPAPAGGAGTTDRCCSDAASGKNRNGLVGKPPCSAAGVVSLSPVQRTEERGFGRGERPHAAVRDATPADYRPIRCFFVRLPTEALRRGEVWYHDAGASWSMEIHASLQSLVVGNKSRVWDRVACWHCPPHGLLRELVGIYPSARGARRRARHAPICLCLGPPRRRWCRCRTPRRWPAWGPALDCPAPHACATALSTSNSPSTPRLPSTPRPRVCSAAPPTQGEWSCEMPSYWHLELGGAPPLSCPSHPGRMEL